MSGNSPARSIIALFGGQTSLARALGISQGTVWGWLDAGYIPSRRIPQIIQAGKLQAPPLDLTYAQFFETPTECDAETAAIPAADGPVHQPAG